nr:hypothetical protein [Tanacetum cinerariifolium]
DVKSAFLYGTIEEEVYVCQPSRFEDPENPDKVYKVVKALYRLHQAPRAWYETLATYLLENGFQRGTIDQTLFIYVAEILRKFGLSEGKSASTSIDAEKPLLKDLDGKDVDVHTYSQENLSILKGKALLGLWYPKDSPFDLVAYSDSDYAGASLDRKSTTRGCQFLGCRLISWQCKKQTVVATSSTDPDGEDVDVHTYRSMIDSLMYLTSSRPDIMFAIYACAHFQVTLKSSHLHAVKRIFRYLKGKLHLGLWYPKDSPFNLVAYSDSDYAGASLDRKSTTGGCQFLG